MSHSGIRSFRHFLPILFDFSFISLKLFLPSYLLHLCYLALRRSRCTGLSHCRCHSKTVSFASEMTGLARVHKILRFTTLRVVVVLLSFCSFDVLSRVIFEFVGVRHICFRSFSWRSERCAVDCAARSCRIRSFTSPLQECILPPYFAS